MSNEQSQQIDLNTIGQNGVIEGAISAEEKEHRLKEKADFVQEEIKKLSEAIEQNAPGYKEILVKVDKILVSYPELTYMLKEEDIGVILQGLQKDSDIQFAVTTKSSGGGKVGKGGKEKIDVQNINEDI